ncbi:hypothetical protein GEMRC1_002215 [Eukaryota sp. GEM-RC1]
MDAHDSRRISSTDRFSVCKVVPGDVSNVLITGTSEGKVLVYKSLSVASNDVSPRHWSLSAVFDAGSSVSSICCSEIDGEMLMLVATDNSVLLLKEVLLTSDSSLAQKSTLITSSLENPVDPWTVTALQESLGGGKVVFSRGDEELYSVQLPSLQSTKFIQSITTNGSLIGVFDGRNCDLFSIKTTDFVSEPTICHLISFSCSSSLGLLLSDYLIVSMGRALVLYALSSNSKPKIADSYNVSQVHGNVVALHYQNGFIGFGTSNGYVGCLKISNISNASSSDAPKKKQHVIVDDSKLLNLVSVCKKKLPSAILEVKVSGNGQYISALCRVNQFGVVSSSVHVLDCTSGLLIPSFSMISTQSVFQSLPLITSSMIEVSDIPRPQIVSFFAVDGLYQQSISELEGVTSFDCLQSLSFLHTPFFGLVDNFFPKGEKRKLYFKKMNDFIGIEQCTYELKSAILKFSKNLCIGNLDSAFKAVIKIDSPVAWSNLVHLCVTKHRLDVAETCLSRMKNAKALRVLRKVVLECQHEPEDVVEKVALGSIAAQLGLYAEAETFFYAADKFKYLIDLYIAQNRFDDAITLAKKHYKIGLRSINHKYALLKEQSGDFNMAFSLYRKAQTDMTEVPRMLLNNGQFTELEEFCRKSKSVDVKQFWAKYLEFSGDSEAALKLHHETSSYYNIVVILCAQNQLAKAIEFVKNLISRELPQAKAAAYHVGVALMREGQNEEAFEILKLSGDSVTCYKLAKKLSDDDYILSLALNSNDAIKIDAAQYFEQSNLIDSAVLLYSKAGATARALDLCIKERRFSALRDLTDGLTNAEPEVLVKVAEFCLSHGEINRGVDLLCKARRFDQALELISKHGIKLTESLAEDIVNNHGDDVSAELILKIAELLEAQGAYQSAAKKYIKAGYGKKAMNSLIRSGVTDKIVAFALASRKAEFYIVAGNYLQTLDWRSNSKCLTQLVTFYRKAKAYTNLASFYDSAAVTEIDEFKSFEQAMVYMDHSVKCLDKAMEKKDVSRDLDFVRRKHLNLSKYLNLRQMFTADPDTATTEALLFLQDLESYSSVSSEFRPLIRPGHVFGLLVEFYKAIGDDSTAITFANQMRDRGISLVEYLEDETVEALLNIEQAPDNRVIEERILLESEEGESFSEEEI